MRPRRRSAVVALTLGLAILTPLRMIVGVSLGLGGLVLMGSSVGSTKQLEFSLKQAEEEWNLAIDALELVQLEEGVRSASGPSVRIAPRCAAGAPGFAASGNRLASAAWLV